MTKKPDAPATPHQRAIRHEKMRKRPIIQMNAAFKQIKPGDLSRQILALTARSTSGKSDSLPHLKTSG
ncbi:MULTISPECIES: hypothetical protein [Pseudarthrobacter]|uniref:hypothetical protein n=1 Tax=Pseudarthrobacter TaxID=1742993 RepID=UPI0013D8F883|nr:MULTISPECIES: hypothetical protein [Pseudarthrobacter]MDP9999779.1 hypothetical protein [Pseudarthrobacter sulfonivorans]